MLSYHLRLGLPSGLLSSGLPTKTLYTPVPSPMRATCPVHLILLDLITLTIFGEEYRLWATLVYTIGGWVSPRAGVDTVVKRKIPSPCQDWNPPIIQPVAKRYTDGAIPALSWTQ
jgi:hypothetical protein